MTDIFAQYAPPFDLTSDMLFALALCPTRPLRRAFPGVPFLSLLGRTPLLLWFSRITQMCYHETEGAEHCLGRSEAGLYHELNVVAFLRKRTLFVPGIYATSELTIRVGHGYGMPKQPTTMQVEVGDTWVRSEVRDGSRQSVVRARLLGSGKGLGKLVSQFLPNFTWPVRFPSGSGIRALIEETPSVQLAYVQEGHLALEAEWLPEAARLLPVGCYLPGLRMQLPPPSEEHAMRQHTAQRSHGMASLSRCRGPGTD
jgi:hypothetical protein